MKRRPRRTALILAMTFLTLPAAAQVQVGDVAPFVTSVDENLHPLSMAEMAAGARAEVRLMTTGGRILAFATSVDNVTGDSTFQPAWIER